MSTLADTPPAVGKTGKAATTERTKGERRLAWKLAGPAFIAMLLVTAYPILNALWLSLYSYRLTDPASRAFIGLKNYAVILSDPVWWDAIKATAFITVVTVAVELVIGFALAMVMNKAIRTLRPVLRTAILIPYAIITVVSAFAWQYAFAVDSEFVNSWLNFMPWVSPTTDWFGNT